MLIAFRMIAQAARTEDRPSPNCCVFFETAAYLNLAGFPSAVLVRAGGTLSKRNWCHFEQEILVHKPMEVKICFPFLISLHHENQARQMRF